MLKGKSVYRLPDSLEGELEKLKTMVAQFHEGSVSFEQLKAFRVPLGVYEQRESGTFMLRIRLPGGHLLPHQMRVMANVSKKYGNSVLHVTTRQDIQAHRVPLDNIHPALVTLYGGGLSTKGGGGNTVRNITACYDAGVCPKEIFDVSPYATALTEFLLPDPLSYQLPRKYKIAFSGCSEDCASATVNDVGFIAKSQNGNKGFAAYVGGGMGAKSRIGDLLEVFVPEHEIHLIAEAIKRVFDKHGNRKNKHKARLRFLIEQIGLQKFRELYEDELSELHKESPKLPEIGSLQDTDKSHSAKETPQTDFGKWRESNVVPQKQEGYFLVHIPLTLGDIDTNSMNRLADVVENHGERMLRTTQNQNAVLRWASDNELPELYTKLKSLGLDPTPPPIFRDLVTCTGASTCQLGICLSRGLSKAIVEKLLQSKIDLNELGDFKVHISGCPNSCGRHPVAQIGLFGAARRIGDRLVPHYIIQLGGKVEEGKTRLATGHWSIPAQDTPSFLADFLGAFVGSDCYPNFETFLETEGKNVADDLALKFRDVPDFEQDKNYYYDWGAENLFSLAGRGPGECSAGVFDLIEVDLASAREALDKKRYFTATALASRALLVTRGEQPDSDAEALKLFQKYFLEEDLVHRSLDKVIEKALLSTATQDPEKSFTGDTRSVASLVGAVKELYDNMDQSLRFTPAKKAEKPEESKPTEESKADRTHDFRGVVCPLNYVKTKLALGQIKEGQTILVLLDKDGATNVPESAAKDGHEVLSKKQEGDHWEVLIRKG